MTYDELVARNNLDDAPQIFKLRLVIYRLGGELLDEQGNRTGRILQFLLQPGRADGEGKCEIAWGEFDDRDRVTFDTLDKAEKVLIYIRRQQAKYWNGQLRDVPVRLAILNPTYGMVMSTVESLGV